MEKDNEIIEIPHSYLKENTYMYSVKNHTYIVSIKDKTVTISLSKNKNNLFLSFDEVKKLYNYILDLEAMLKITEKNKILNKLYPHIEEGEDV